MDAVLNNLQNLGRRGLIAPVMVIVLLGMMIVPILNGWSLAKIAETDPAGRQKTLALP